MGESLFEMKDKITQLEWLALRLVLENDGLTDNELAIRMSEVYNPTGGVMDLFDYIRVKDNLMHVLDYKEGRVYLK